MANNDSEIKVDVEAGTPEDATLTPLEQFFYHQRRALEETGKALEALLPPGFREHGSEASREFTKGFRILVDAAIDELKKVSEKDEEVAAEKKLEDDDDDDDDRPSTTGKTKVKVKLD